ncbi:uncharacterized protein isoform X2 [Rhodnius prolixus]|uniref:Uncharacterized protein n=1 Tax=Rhodnius prolixus TaxID=13249 RepID=T1HPM4_RHOPR
MPGLHDGNLCWGNRKSFYINGEYPLEAQPAMDFKRYEAVAQQNIVYISSNSYYGYHKKPSSEISDESMDTEENNNPECDGRVQFPNSIVCRKRHSNEQTLDNVKRVRFQEASEPSETLQLRDGQTRHMHTYNLGIYML